MNLNLLDLLIRKIALFFAETFWSKKYNAGKRTEKRNPFYSIAKKQFIGRYNFAEALVKNKTVLDIACGEGLGSFILATSAKKVVGADYDKKVIKDNLKRYKKDNLSFVTENAEKLNLNQNFDAIVSFETIEHLNKPKKFLEGSFKTLKKKGLLIISTPNGQFKKDYFNGKYFCPTHIKEFNESKLKEMLSDAGFKKIKFYYYHLFNKKAGLISIPFYFLINKFKVLNQPENKNISPLTFVIIAKKYSK